MRVTNQMMVGKFLTNINRSTTRLDKLTQQLSSGQAVSRPSDDPTALAQIMTFKRGISQAEQYTKNIDTAQGWQNSTDSAYGQVTDVLHRIQELGVRAANGTWNDTDRANFSVEVDELVKEFVQIANTGYEGKYLFSGKDLNQPPFQGNLNSDFKLANTFGSLSWQIEVGPNVTIEMNNDANKLFVMDDAATTEIETVFSRLKDLSTSIRDNDGLGITNGLNDLDKIMDSFLEERVRGGIKTTRLDMLKEKYTEEIVNLKGMISKVGDTDIAEAMMNYTMEETLYQAALSSGSKIMQISLLDYLR